MGRWLWLGEALEIREEVEGLRFFLKLPSLYLVHWPLFLVEDAKMYFFSVSAKSMAAGRLDLFQPLRQLFHQAVVVIIRVEELGARAVHVDEGESLVPHALHNEVGQLVGAGRVAAGHEGGAVGRGRAGWG